MPLELVALGYEREGDRLTVRGIVRNPSSGAPLDALTAVVFLFNGDGRFLGSGRATVESPALGPGGESAFLVTVPGARAVGRYRVSFRSEDRVVPHVDRREHRTREFMTRLPFLSAALSAAAVVCAHGQQAQQPPARPSDRAGVPLQSGVELINVTATVSDASGRFVPGLKADDFLVYEDDQPVEVTHFSAERVPVSLGIALDTSGSMAGDKIQEAQSALDRFLYDLLDQQDEIFLYRFSNYPTLLQGWTTDRQLLPRALGRIDANGGTAMYDAVAEAIPLAAAGTVSEEGAAHHLRRQRHVEQHRHPRGEAADSRERSAGLRDRHRRRQRADAAQRTPAARASPFPIPIPFPGGRRRPDAAAGHHRSRRPAAAAGRSQPPNDDRVNVVALRDMTDDSGGRTEIIRDARDLNPATASIADELSKRYYLGYPSHGKKDGRWHSIRVEVRNRDAIASARDGVRGEL